MEVENGGRFEDGLAGVLKVQNWPHDVALGPTVYIFVLPFCRGRLWEGGRHARNH